MTQIATHPKKNAEIECLRGIAILFVYLLHLPGLFLWHSDTLSMVASGLWLGVDLFFAISGFVIAHSTLESLQGAQGEAFWRQAIAFWIRRAWRILPTAWLWLFLPLLVLQLASGMHPQPNYQGQLADVVAAVLQVANFHYYHCSVDASQSCGSFSTYWTLSLEEQFYLCLPFAVLMFRRRVVWFFLALAVVQIPLARIHWQGLLSFVRTDAISLGVCLAVFARSPHYKLFEPTFLRGRAQIVCAALLIVALATLARYQIVSFFLGLAAIVSVIAIWVASYGKGYLFRRPFTLAVLGWIGERSFAIYMCHIPIFWCVRAYWEHHMPAGGLNGSYFLRFLLPSLIFTPIVAELNYRFLETPLRRKGRQIAARFIAQGPTAVPAPTAGETPASRIEPTLSTPPVFSGER